MQHDTEGDPLDSVEGYCPRLARDSLGEQRIGVVSLADPGVEDSLTGRRVAEVVIGERREVVSGWSIQPDVALRCSSLLVGSVALW
jgi:hypothetical protein